ncbi:MAG: hypothetical protein H6702_02705 [Myxococcales bacterium]|nr:hypothetical protein [Myxococcales bacterium]
MWRRHHEDTRAADCAPCHGPSPCAGCHRTATPGDHGPAYGGPAHAGPAAADPTRCATCHAVSDCLACHTR